MKINRQALIQALEVVSPALGGTGSPVGMQMVRIYNGVVQASNGLVTIQTALPSDLGYKITVPGAPFIALLKSLKTDDVELKLGKDNKYLAVRTEKLEGKFNSTGLDTFVDVDFSMWRIIHDPAQCMAIIDGLVACRNNVSKDENAGALRGVRIEGNRIISTNRNRIFRFPLPIDTGWHCTVHTAFIDAIQAHREQLEAILLLTDEGLGVMAGNVMIQAKLIDGKFPELDQYFPNEQSMAGAKNITFDDTISDVLGRQIEFVKGMDPADKESVITVAGKSMSITAKNPSIGEIAEVVTLENEVDQEITFLINPVLMKDIAAGNTKFSYLPDSKLIMFEHGGTKHLLQTRE